MVLQTFAISLPSCCLSSSLQAITTLLSSLIIWQDTTYTFDDIASQLEIVKQQLKRDYPITMEVLGITSDCPIYNKLHNRMIISNYYMVEASHKLAAFNKEIGTARQLLFLYHFYRK